MVATAVTPQPLELAFASLPEPTLVVDGEGDLAAVNAAAEALLGGSARRGAAAATALPWLAPALHRVLGGADEAGVEAEVATPDGPRLVAARVRRMGDADHACGAVAVLQDLSARRALDARLQSVERLAALGALAAGLAHEVNNPLACVVAGLSFVEGEHERIASALGPAELAEARAALEEARDAARRVGRIVHSLQRFGTPAAPLVADVDLGAALEKALAHAAPALRDRACVEARLERRVSVRASESLLTEMFLSLLESAAGSLPAGRTAPRALSISMAVRGEMAEVRLTCAGGDESPPCEAGPFSPGAPGRGAGLGLSVAQGIAAALGGALSVDAPARGSACVLVTLPLSAPP
ncbi:MAG TPA: PAS domain-containing protein [Anaeromyxobacteraceae bacterium]|nr:PAS domain-containing protein [Anaeromyxobacteraceae bacterium]